MNSIRLNLVFYEHILNHYRLMENIYWENSILQVKVRHIKNRRKIKIRRKIFEKTKKERKI